MPKRPTMPNIERRHLFGQEVRAEGEGDARKIVGYGAVFYREGDPSTQYQLWPGTVERFMPGAFDRAVKEDDVRGLFNHAPSQVLGRNKAGTMTLVVDDKGLRYEITPGKTTIAADVIEHIDRGDVTGSSTSFRTNADGVEWITEEIEGVEIEVRQIYSVTRLYDVGPVTFPAYAGADAALRSESDFETIRQEYEKQHSGEAVAQMRSRLRKLRTTA